jgi:hypothetical protein
MAKRKSLCEPREARTREPNSERPVAYGYQIRSRNLSFENDVLRIKLRHSENHKEDARQIDFATCFLPPNRLHDQVTLLKDRPDLARVLVAVVDTYLIRQKNSKSTASTAKTMAGTVLRFLEYCWLNDIYHLKNVGPAQWEIFLRRYASGGWPEVLELERRGIEIDIRTLPLSRRYQKQGVVKYSCSALLEAIGTNVFETQVRLEYERGAQTGYLKRARGDGPMSESVITQLICQLNNLVDIPKEMRAQSLAHANPYLFAASVDASPQQRTENFDPRSLCALMAESYRWVAHYGEAVVEIARTAYADLTTLEQEAADESRLFRALECPRRIELERLLGTRITSVRRMGDWKEGIGLVGLIRTLLASCFLLLGVFNARRKDEIQSRSIGLYAGAFSCVDEEMSLYQSYFYCEKTSQDYVEFFVNEISFKAMKLCKALSDVSWEAVVRNGGANSSDRARKLFCMPPREGEKSPCWYDYSTDPGVALLCERATGDEKAIVPNAHMFRRAYAVVFHYRYENADLYALSQQLDHLDLNMTLHYVLEGASRIFAHHAAVLWGDGGKTKTQRALRARELSGEVKEYGEVKLHDDVLEILTGSRVVSGRFQRLVQRFAQKMYGRIKYDDTNLREAVAGVTQVLIGRGHTVTTMPHGNCNAGPARASAGCFIDGRLARERASPLTCGNCPYHTMKTVQLQAVKDDLVRQRIHLSRLPGNTLQSSHARESLEATERLVQFYDQRQAGVEKSTVDAA